MIYVTVGTAKQQFDRLIKLIDQISPMIDEEIIIQIGYSTYKPRNSLYIHKCTPIEHLTYMSKARFVISHAGAGTVIEVLKHKKKLMVMPRLKKFGEHYNNHQLELAKALDKYKLAVSLLDINTPDKVFSLIKKMEGFSIDCSEKMLISVALQKQLSIWKKTN